MTKPAHNMKVSLLIDLLIVFPTTNYLTNLAHNTGQLFMQCNAHRL